MQNLKSLDNLHSTPVLGRNDNTLGLVGREKLDIYSWEAETRDMIRKVMEPQRNIFAHELLVDTEQD